MPLSSAGDLTDATGESVTLSPCLGGLVQTWNGAGEPRLWRVENREVLEGLQGRGVIGRTYRNGEPPADGVRPRFREAGVLFADAGMLLVSDRVPLAVEETEEGGTVSIQSHQIGLVPYSTESPASELVLDDFRKLLDAAVPAALKNHEYLMIEQGGWDAPEEPFCMWSLFPGEDDLLSVVQASPVPEQSNFWPPRAESPDGSASLSAPLDLNQGQAAVNELIHAVSTLMLDVVVRWGLVPWELALTFGPWPFDHEPGQPEAGPN